MRKLLKVSTIIGLVIALCIPFVTSVSVLAADVSVTPDSIASSPVSQSFGTVTDSPISIDKKGPQPIKFKIKKKQLTEMIIEIIENNLSDQSDYNYENIINFIESNDLNKRQLAEAIFEVIKDNVTGEFPYSWNDILNFIESNNLNKKQVSDVIIEVIEKTWDKR